MTKHGIKHTAGRCGDVPGLRTVPFLMLILVIILHVFFVSQRLLLNRDLPVTLEIKHWRERIMRIWAPWTLDSFAQHSNKECSTILLKLSYRKWLPLSTAWAFFPFYNHKKFRMTVTSSSLPEEPLVPTPHHHLFHFLKANMFAFLILFSFLL